MLSKRILDLAGVENLLCEMPIPDDWDKNEFKKSFASQIRYATNMAKKLGVGSSRVAFIIPYQGRETVLKIAKNNKGLMQNQKEADYLEDPYIDDCVIPLIDYDKENEMPKWIHTEKAEKLTKSLFKTIEGFSFDTFATMLDNTMNPKYARDVDPIEEDLINNSELYNNVRGLHYNFGLELGDFTILANWGVYQGRPVVIDLGFDKETLKTYYKK